LDKDKHCEAQRRPIVISGSFTACGLSELRNWNKGDGISAWLFWCSMTSSYEFCRLYACYISNTLFEVQASADGNLEKAKISGVATPILFSRLAPSQSKHKHCDHWQLFVSVSVAKFNHLSPLRTASSQPWSSWHLRVFWYCCLGALQWMAVVLASWWRKQMKKEWNRYHHTASGAFSSHSFDPILKKPRNMKKCSKLLANL